MASSVVERLAERSAPEPNTGCVLWLRSVNTNGSAQIMIDGKRRVAHRVAYELAKGPIPPGLTLDHLCRVRNCINPEHLEPVTQRTNVLRGNGVAATASRKTHCSHGHEFMGANTYFVRGRNGQRWRGCRACRVATRARRRATP